MWVKKSHFAKDIEDKTINAVGETVFEKQSLRNSITTKRCLPGVHGFSQVSWRDQGEGFQLFSRQ